MKTISECFIHIVGMSFLTFLGIIFTIVDFISGSYWAAIFLFLMSALGIWNIWADYKTAKAIEQTMRPRIEVKIIIKDKDDEVEADK